MKFTLICCPENGVHYSRSQAYNPAEANMRINQWVIGYDRRKFKTGPTDAPGDRKDERNYPHFWLVNLQSPPPQSVIKINQEEKAQTNDLFYDWKDFNQVTVRLQVHGRAVSVFQGKFYFNVTRANRCHTFDTLTRQVAYIDYPPVTKKQSHFAYFDDAARQMYVVKKVKANQYLIFLYQPGDGSLTLQGESEVEPQGFTGGKMHIMKRLKLPGEKPFFGHYLRPLTPEPVTDERPRMILKTVEIKQ